jgi:predicted small lipoprotein YifL
VTRFRRVAILAALAALAACGSGNPDALTNPNLEQSAADENADLNADDVGDSDATAPPSTETAPAAAADNDAPERVDETANRIDEADEPATEPVTVANDSGDEENESTEPPEF